MHACRQAEQLHLAEMVQVLAEELQVARGSAPHVNPHPVLRGRHRAHHGQAAVQHAASVTIVEVRLRHIERFQTFLLGGPLHVRQEHRFHDLKVTGPRCLGLIVTDFRLGHRKSPIESLVLILAGLVVGRGEIRVVA